MVIPNKYIGVSFDKTQQISRFIGKSWTAGHLVHFEDPGRLPAI